MSSWDAVLLDLGDTALLRIARQRRLVLEDGNGPQWVDLCWVDEVALALIDFANSRRRDLTIVYPAPAGQVSVLLGAQLLLQQFVEGNTASSVGIVTADTTMAIRTWNSLRVATTGDRPPIGEVFPCYRAGPDGTWHHRDGRFQGVVVGQACKGWKVDRLIVDRIAGPVRVDTDQASIEVVADPTDPILRHAESSGRAVWGWSKSSLTSSQMVKQRRPGTVPFSVASERLATLADGVEVRLEVARHQQAEAAIARAQEDLRMLRTMSPRGADRNVERGLSIAWHHLNTLVSLPCRPSRFDRFSGVPPIAARSTRTFAKELTAWAGTLDENRAEIASILASDIADLRAALELGNPFERMLLDSTDTAVESIVVTRTRTASYALLEALSLHSQTDKRASRIKVTHIGDLHRQGVWPRAIFIGEPQPWDWHRILSGLAPVVNVFTLGEQSARDCAQLVEAMRNAQDHWGSLGVRERTWRAVIGGPPPATPDGEEDCPRPAVVIADGAEYLPERDPFESLSSLFELDPLDVGGEGPTRSLAQQTDQSTWSATVPALEVVTNLGRLMLEAAKPVDVRVGDRIEERHPEELQPGSILLVGRRQGRVGLLEALEERLRDRSDLVAARYLLEDYRCRVRKRREQSGLSLTALHRSMIELGCNRTLAAVRSWVTEKTLAPQHLQDLKYLNEALDLGMTDTHMHELFAGVRRRRGFRRSAGRALASAVRDSMVASDDERIDSETGLTVADLREAVVEATVISVTSTAHLVPVTLLGILEDP